MENYILIFTYNNSISKIPIYLKDSIKTNQTFYRKQKFIIKSKIKGGNPCFKTEKSKA